MTLYRQLIIFTSLLFFLLFAGTWYAKVDSTRTFLTDQLESHAQDAATSLALSITPHAAEKDNAAIESIINAMFDGGYYQIIRFTDTRKKVLVERQIEVQIEKVPSWFIRLLPLKTPEATSDVMAGWIQAGSIYVKSHPGYAYNSLWNDVLNMTLWFGLCALIVLITGSIGLRILLKPLVLVERQADDLCKKEYRIQEPLPWTKDFRRVVEAMNRMTNKVKEMFEEQVVQAEALRERAYNDNLTGLGNRRYFESQITARLEQRDGSAKGAVFIVRIHDLENLNRRKGFEAGDALLKLVADTLRNSALHYPNAVLARLTGGDFGFFSADTSQSEAAFIAESITEGLMQVAAAQITDSDDIGHVGAATYDSPTTIARLLSEADLALCSAIEKGPGSWDIRFITPETDSYPLGQQQWKDILVAALQERKISLALQPVVAMTSDRKILHMEVLSRIIRKDGTLLYAGTFMPLAERLKLASSVDRLVLEEVTKLDCKRLGTSKIAVNLSPSSLEDQTFIEWTRSLLNSLPDGAPRMYFEFSEIAAVQHLELLKEFSSMVRLCGHGLGFDHYGQSFSKLGYLQSLRPDYVKVDRAYTGELKDEESDSRFYISSLCSVAHSIDIEVIAEGVETEQQMHILKELHLDGIQGYLTGRPLPLAELHPD